MSAAIRQLQTAIRLWFQEEDEISIHALAYAAYEIVHVISKKHNKYRIFLVFDTDMVKEEFRAEWNKKLKINANFFKHAKNDAEASIEFMPSLTLLYIMGASTGLSLMPRSN